MSQTENSFIDNIQTWNQKTHSANFVEATKHPNDESQSCDAEGVYAF